MSDLLDTYRASGPGHDEMLQATGAARAAWEQMADLVDLHSWAQLADARTDVATLLAERGVRHGADPDDQPWLLDPLPVMVDEVEWAGIEAGLRQRAALFDAILVDLYGERRLLTSGILPTEIVLAHPGFLRAVHDVRIPGEHQLFLHAADIARNADGSWAVLADRTQAPSGLGYAMAGRRVIAQVLAGLYRQARIRRLGPFFHSMRSALQEVAPPGAGDVPRVAILTPGPYSETTFDHGYLSSILGVTLVEGEDLEVADGRVWMRSIQGREPVDVLLRRVDAEFCDPLDLRGDSQLGVPGLVQAARDQAVTIVNPLGTGVLENPALLTYLPRICRELLDEELLLPSVATYWCGQRSMGSHVISNLDRLIVRHTSPDAPQIHGWDLSIDARADLSAEIAANPHQWVGQEPVEASTTPTLGDGALQAHPTMLRTFALARPAGYEVMSGALAQVAGDTSLPDDGSLGGAAKDLWVLSTEPQESLEPWLADDEQIGTHLLPAQSISAGAAENLFWFGRYAERAEATVRLIRTVADLWADYHAVPDSPGGQSLAVMTHALGEVTTPGPLSDVVLGNQPGAVGFAVTSISRAATAVRDQLPSDIWLALASVERALMRENQQRPQPGNDGLGRVLARVLEGLLAMSAITEDSMVHDVGWSLMDIGRRMERAQHLVMTLHQCLIESREPVTEAGVLESLLSAHESAGSYRRRYQRRPRLDSFLDLLLLDRTNPRSLAYQLGRIERRLAEIPTPVRRADSRDQLLADLMDLIAEAEVGLLGAVRDGADRPRLAEALGSVRWRLSELANEIARVHFSHPVPSQWLDATGPRVPTAAEEG